MELIEFVIGSMTIIAIAATIIYSIYLVTFHKGGKMQKVWWVLAGSASLFLIYEIAKLVVYTSYSVPSPLIMVDILELAAFILLLCAVHIFRGLWKPK